MEGIGGTWLELLVVEAGGEKLRPVDVGGRSYLAGCLLKAFFTGSFLEVPTYEGQLHTENDTTHTRTRTRTRTRAYTD